MRSFNIYVRAIFVLIVINGVTAANSPHIVIIIADDLGWNDVSFHGSDQIPTPNIDALAYNGVILNSHYVQPMCTPSRAALVTGKYPMKMGMQGKPIAPSEPTALPEGKILPEYMKELGYSTQYIGKWHLGAARWNDTPTHRGFDHHLGFLNGFISYYDFLATWHVNGVDYTGFDMRRDHEPAWDLQGQYVTDGFTDAAKQVIQSHETSKPLFMVLSHLAVHAGNDGKLLEAPLETINKFSHIVDSNRRTYAAMVSKLDDSVGAVVEALDQKDMLQNSIIVFMSDNGAPVKGLFANWGSNHPLRGVKSTVFEGGVRGVSFVWSPLIVQNARVSNELMHITDWFPTLYAAAGGDVESLSPDIDGLDQWSSLVYDLPSARTDIMINFDEKTKNAALRFNNWKLIVGVGPDASLDGYIGEEGTRNKRELFYNTSEVTYSPAGRSAVKVTYTPITEQEYSILRDQATVRCLPKKAKRNPCELSSTSVCLYDIPSDPCEENNLATYFPAVVRRLKLAVLEYKMGLVPQIDQPPDIERADPKLFQYTWNPWLDCLDATCSA